MGRGEIRVDKSRETVGGAGRQASGGGKGSVISRHERAPRLGSAPRGLEEGAGAGPAPQGLAGQAEGPGRAGGLLRISKV